MIERDGKGKFLINMEYISYWNAQYPEESTINKDRHGELKYIKVLTQQLIR